MRYEIQRYQILNYSISIVSSSNRNISLVCSYRAWWHLRICQSEDDGNLRRKEWRDDILPRCYWFGFLHLAHRCAEKYRATNNSKCVTFGLYFLYNIDWNIYYCIIKPKISQRYAIHTKFILFLTNLNFVVPKITNI